MDTSELLTTRCSAFRLVRPAPAGEQLQNILWADMRAPDYKTLQPWQFFVIEDEGRERFSAVPEKGAIAAGSDEKAQDKVCSVPFRAPLIITVMAKREENDKVPPWEQEMSAGCMVMVTQMAVTAQGFGGIWRSSALAESAVVRKVSDCRSQDKIVGFLYLGTPQLKASTTINLADPSAFVRYF